MRGTIKIILGSLAGAVAIHVIFVACGDASAPGVLGSNDAQAANSGCTCTQSGAAKTITADTDLGQLQSGVVKSGNAKAVDGPFVVTDLSIEGQDTAMVFVSADCGQAQPGFTLVGSTIHQSSGNYFPSAVHGARIAVPQGQSLCVTILENSDSAFWSGFVPYQ